MPSRPMIATGGKKKLRPSSASGNLQSHPCFHSSLYDNVARPVTSVVRGSDRDESLSVRRPATHAAGPRYQTRNALSDSKVTEAARRQRRLTIGVTDGIGEADNIVRPGHHVNTVTVQNIKGKIEEKINIDTLEELKAAFAKADVNKSGKLDLDEFKALLKSQLTLTLAREQQIDALFMKIDWSSENYITWDEFCTYMQLEYAEKEDSYLRAKEVSFHLPAKIEALPHRDPILRITSTPDGTFIACSQDGQVSFWTSTLEQKRKLKPLMETNSRQKPKWITDFVIMSQYNKFIVSTGDRELQFFELSSLEPYCQIGGLETVPLKLDYCSTGHDECLLLFGDSQGCVNILVITSVGECLRTWKKLPKHEGFIASVSLDAVASGPHVQFIRWNVHGDWIQQLKYYHDMRQVISCSNNANSALVIGCTTGSTHVEQQLKEVGGAPERPKPKVNFAYGTTKTRLDADQTVFKVYKGVKCFDFSKSKNIIVTGGMDRIVRIWNPYVPLKPTGMLRGHNAPIFYLFIAEEDNRVFSISTDKCIKIWDIQDQSCLLTVRPKGHKIRGDLQSIHYSPASKALAVATDQMAVLSLRLRPILHADIAITHKAPVTCVRFNRGFRQVVTCSEGSTIKLWDLDTGSPIFEFGEAHENEAVTCMTFDNTGRRLITGGRDGCMRIWNYNNGHCLRVLKKSNTNEEICSCTYVEMNRNRYVISVGWDRRINIYSDSLDGNIHHIQHPLPKWADDLRHGHKEDILSVAQCPPNLLATSSYDGEVIVWNMISGHIFCHLHAPPPNQYIDQSLDGDMGINQVTFMRSRSQQKDAASLVTSGPRGHIHMWNVFQGGTLMAQFKGSKMAGGVVTCVAVNTSSTLLFSTDSFGFIYVWKMDGYCMETEEADPPELLGTWRGHVESVTWLELVEENKILLTSSNDCTVRMWTLEGEYVGTFGQSEPWDLHNPATYQHPMVPYDVLVDPLSLPDHPILSDKHSTDTTPEGTAPSSPAPDKEKRTPTPNQQFGKHYIYVDDETIAEQLKDKPFNKGTGKRLRHEKTKPLKREGGGPSEYRMLRCYDLMATPQPTPPQLRINKDDPFNFYVD